MVLKRLIMNYFLLQSLDTYLLDNKEIAELYEDMLRVSNVVVSVINESL